MADLPLASSTLIYITEQQCYYAEKRLPVTAVEGRPNLDYIAPAADGTSQFGVARPADLILARVDGNRLPGPAREASLKHSSLEFPLRTTLLYLLFGGLWILLSDQVLQLFVFYTTQQAIYQTFKGWLFILVSGILLYLLLHRDSEERKRSEDGLHRFELLSSHSQDIILFMRREDGRLLEVNAAAIQAYGYSREELLEFTVRDLRAPDTLGLTAEHMAQADAGGILFETVHRRKDGSTFPVEVSSQGATINGMRTLVSVVRDITERKEAEEKVRRSEETLRAVLGQMPSGVTVRDAHTGTLILFNARGREIMGALVDSTNQFAEYRGFHPDGRPYQIEDWPLARSMHTGEVVHAEEVTYERNDGIRITLSVNSAPVRDRQGQILMGVSVFDDITERKQAEEQLRYQAALLSSVNDAVIASDSQFHITAWNSGAESLYGWKAEEVIGRNGVEIVRTQWPEKAADEMRRVIAETGRWRGEATQARKDGTRFPVEASSIVLRDNNGQISGYISVNRDITERKRAEEALKGLTEDLRRSNAELEQFAYVASHDLQEPLRMVSSYMQLLKRRYQGRLDNDADEFIHYAVDGATRMQNLINDLLAFSRVGTRGHPMGLSSCEKVLAEALLNLQVAIEESEAIISHDPLPIVYCDQPQLVQVFQNLLGNSLKFRGQPAPHIHISANRAESEWIFSFDDNGIGLDSKFGERIFEIFQRLHSRTTYPGTGIGLAICKRIIQRHGGRIWVESTPGEGATFYFTLPIKENT